MKQRLWFHQGFFQENVKQPVWTCRDPISLILGTRAGLKAMQPMQLHWAVRLWGSRASGGPAPLGAPRLWGPRASGGPAPWCLGRLFIFVRYSGDRKLQKRLKNLIVIKQYVSLLPNNYLVGTNVRSISSPNIIECVQRYICSSPCPLFMVELGCLSAS